MSFRNPVTSLPADAITSGNLGATYTLTGTIRTAASPAARVEIDNAGIRAYDGTNTNTVNIKSADGSVAITGSLTSLNTGRRVIVSADNVAFASGLAHLTDAYVTSQGNDTLWLSSGTTAVVRPTAAQISVTGGVTKGAVNVLQADLAASGIITTGAGFITEGSNPVPWGMSAGVANVALAAATQGSLAVTFPVGRFSFVPPIVTMSANDGNSSQSFWLRMAAAVSLTGFTAVVNTTAAITATYKIGWIAIAMSQGSAAG